MYTSAWYWHVYMPSYQKVEHGQSRKVGLYHGGVRELGGGWIDLGIIETEETYPSNERCAKVHYFLYSTQVGRRYCSSWYLPDMP